jgi:hypothetical protein
VALWANGVAHVNLTSAGFFGIGKDVPSGPLHIKGANGLYVEGAVNTNVGRMVMTGSQNEILAVGLNGIYANGRVKLGAGAITAANGGWIDSFADGQHIFYGASSAEIGRFTAARFFGLGTATPAHKLTVQDTVDTYAQIATTATDGVSGVVLLNDSRSWVIRNNGANGDSLEIRDATANAQRLIINAAGNATFSNQLSASQFNGSAAGLTGLRTVNGNSIVGSGNIQIDGGVTSFNTRTGAVTLSSSDVTTALGFTPYNSTNPSGYVTSSALSSYLPLSGGTIAGNGTLDFGPNSSWGATLRIGGNGHTGTGRASVVTTSGNLHLDGAANNGTYLNWYNSGTTGTYFGNGAGAQVGRVTGGGAASFASLGLNGGFTISDGGSGYGLFSSWVRINGHHGFYSGINNAHILPNDGTYGGWRIDGSRNGWQGIEFSGHTTLMMNDDTYGFHRNSGGSWRFYVTGGSGHFPGNVVAYWSDERLKENLREIRRESLDILGSFTAYRFNWNAKVAEVGDTIPVGKEEIGLIAQHVQRTLPDAVVVNKAGAKIGDTDFDYLTINYDRITPLLVEGVNIHEKEISELKLQVGRLEGIIKSLTGN